MSPPSVSRPAAPLRPEVVGRLNERQILRFLRDRGPLSRAELVRQTGLSAPTVSKAAAALLRAGLVEEVEATENGRGRPAPKLRVASRSAQVLGIAVDAGHCEVIAAGLDGVAHGPPVCVPTPGSYEQLIVELEAVARRLMSRPGVATLGFGMSLPGLIDDRSGRGVLSPNVPMTNGHTPAADLAGRLGIPGTLVQESHALCLAERDYGAAQGVDDFAVLDVGTGIGLGVMTRGRLLKGHCGLAGEIGHLTTVAVGGRRCGCGNTGCLETLASQSALAYHAGVRLGRPVGVDEVIDLIRTGAVDLGPELDELAGYLAVGVAAVVNLFNPAVVFLYSPLLEVAPGLLERVAERARRRALPPSFAHCRVLRAEGTKRQGAVAAAIRRLTDSLAPEFA